MRKKRLLGMWLGGLLLAAGCARADIGSDVAVLKVGQADAILVTAGDRAVLIDAGEEDDGGEILRALAARGVKKIDAMIVTHYDKDHVGGAPEVMDGVAVGTVYDAAYEPGGKRYAAYVEAIEANGVPRMRVTAALQVAFGNLSLTILPTALPFENDNDQSLAVLLNDGAHTFLFCGDAEEARVDELLAAGVSACDVIKMPHHGRSKTNLGELLDAARPRVALITDSDKNQADEMTLTLLSERGIAAYETRYGDILIESRPEGLRVNQ